MRLTDILSVTALAIAAAAVTGCSDSKTYAELLNDENAYTNAFLADHRVVNYVPENNEFETGPDAPYYRLDEDGQMYMQVIDAGTPDNMVKADELIYFRYTRYPLSTYSNGEFTYSDGNDDALGGNYSFRYGNYETNSSYSAGPGVQAPLEYLPVDCQVNLVIKSQYGKPGEIANVQPYLYSLRYFRPKI
ncbi:MAG: DUF4827 domain-containing protein [Muribaculaceae bacterium]|nr:DUF4827 domain-containing protein [Muribaculaceae bacterium]